MPLIELGELGDFLPEVIRKSKSEVELRCRNLAKRLSVEVRSVGDGITMSGATTKVVTEPLQFYAASDLSTGYVAGKCC